LSKRVVSEIMLTLLLVTAFGLSLSKVSVEASSEVRWAPEDYSILQGNPDRADPILPVFGDNKSFSRDFVPGEMVVSFKSNVSIEHVNGLVTTGFSSVDELNERY